MARILIQCTEVVGRNMAGPAIRSWELAWALSRNHEVTLAVPNEVELDPGPFTMRRYVGSEHVAGHDVLLCQIVTPQLARAARAARARIVVDAYDPMSVEHLERERRDPLADRLASNSHYIALQNFSFRMADHIVCASEKQRDLWLGVLTGLGLVTPRLYDADTTLRSYIDVLPFGLPTRPPQRTGAGPRAQFGLADSDVLILWGGGIWEWFDPISVISAVAHISTRRTDVKLVFMGLTHPNPRFGEAQMSRRAVAHAEELGVKDRFVFFNEGWVPYGERANYLLDANVGISAHYDNLETRFSFRTRMLDYIWSGLPMISTVGDYFAEVIERDNLGFTVAYQGVAEIEAAIETLAGSPGLVDDIRDRLDVLRPQLRWETLTGRLEDHVAGTGGPRPAHRSINRRLASYYADVVGSAARAAGPVAAVRHVARLAAHRQR